MITMAQRIEALRTERNLSRPTIAAELGFPKTAFEKFETGRQTPTKEQQEKMSAYFGVSLFYLRGESDDRTQMTDWMNATFADDEPAAPVYKKSPKSVAAPTGGQVGMFDSFLTSKKFQESLRAAVLDVLRSPEGSEIITRTIRKELSNQK